MTVIRGYLTRTDVRLWMKMGWNESLVQKKFAAVVGMLASPMKVSNKHTTWIATHVNSMKRMLNICIKSMNGVFLRMPTVPWKKSNKH